MFDIENIPYIDNRFVSRIGTPTKKKKIEEEKKKNKRNKNHLYYANYKLLSDSSARRANLIKRNMNFFFSFSSFEMQMKNASFEI